MKYRAGIAPVRTSNKRKSEYAYKYDWKKPIENAPLLAADKILHNSNHNIGYAKDKIPKRSEYQKQYKAWTYRPVVTQDETTPDQIRKTIITSKIRRARSEMNLSPDKLPAAGSPSRIQHDNQRLTQSLNPQKPFFPLRRTVSWTSEYMSNFQPFSSFEYQQGAWKNSNPPHLNQANPVQVVPRERSDSWLLEVKELRDRAEEYRKRSLGTHFSRAHVGQLLSENSKLWDMVSVSSELSALDLEQSQVTAKSPTENTQPKKRERTQSAQAVLNPGERTSPSKKERVRTGVLDDSKVRKRLAWSSDGSRSASPSDSARSIRSSNQSITTDQVQEKSAESGSQGSESTENGRVQTPEIVTSPVVRRHHLDVTTPNRHGLLLSGPNHHSPKESRQNKSQRATKEDAVVTQNTRKRNDSLEVVVPSQGLRKTLLSPTYGKPTEDAHDLLDEDIPEPVDVILETRYVQSPSKKSNQLNPVLEGAGMTYNISKMNLPDRKREDDEMSHSSQFSDSMMSVISNSSQRANETLHRATRRQKEFWRTDNS